MNKIREECGVFGIYSQTKSDVAATTYYALFSLQHRGQESCGIVVNDGGRFISHKDPGLVNDVFTPEILSRFGQGSAAVGHVRYGAGGSADRSNSQPLIVNHINGCVAFAHNGSLVNSDELRDELELQGSIFHTTCDAEVISYIITKERINRASVEDAVCSTMYKIKGAYSLVIMSRSKLIAVRDPMGFRPLCYGRTKDGAYAVASESCALDSVGAEFIRDVLPGEILVFDKNGVRSLTEHCGKQDRRLCVFEFIYFARPDSVIDGCSVLDARLRAGAFLALEHPVAADIVIGVPDSGIDAAIGFSRQSGIPYGIGFIKNKYIGRTFIDPGQKAREDKVRIKLNPIAETVRGKRVVLIDDSIVRGTTGRRIVKLLRDAGATEVHMRISAPPFKNPCYYGTDIDSKEHLIANRHTVEEISGILGTDSLGYLSIEHVGMLTRGGESGGFCSACFDGLYPTAIPESPATMRPERKITAF